MHSPATSDPTAHSCIHHLFEAQVARDPESTALVFEGEPLSYGELNARANRLAHRLIALGIRPDQRVAICVERSPAMIVGLMAILKAGGAYVPLDPENTGERLAFMLADAAPVLVLADTAGRRALRAALQGHTVLDPCDIYGEVAINPEVVDLRSSHLAYIIYTSGSTGQPKGVMVEHAQVVRLFDTTHSAFDFGSGDIWCFFHSFAFDFSVWELWGALRYGGTLVLVPQAITRAPEAFYQLIREQGITVLNQTPSAFAALMEHMKPSMDQLRFVILGGEALASSTLRKWYEGRDGAVPQLVNMYGITETTVHVTYYPLSRADAQQADSVIGRCLPDLNLYLLDTDGKPVPLGDVGEMYIGGAGVARGYLNRPALTEERFLHDPFADRRDARMYRSGDLARYLANGELAFMGRNDDQVKIRGFRIELGEIAARLTEHPSVREAVVVAQGEESDKRLVAYIVAQSTGPGTQPTGVLRDYLSGVLPDYMVPTAYVRMDSFPLTTNGKLDRKALPSPQEDAFAHAPYQAPSGEIEVALARIWSELLGVDQVGRHDNFFALGGHSLLAVRLRSRIANLGADLQLAILFAAPTLEAIALAIETQRHAGAVVHPSIRPFTRDKPLLPSFAQQRLWFLAQLDSSISDAYHIPLALKLRGQLDVIALQQALDALWSRHEVLRSVFAIREGEVEVRLLACDPGLPLRRINLPETSKRTGAETALAILCTDEAQAPFDLETGPLIRACLVRASVDSSTDEHVLLITQHHIVSDGWSLGILLAELSSLYTAFSRHQANPLPPLAIQYPDYAAWQRLWLSGDRLNEQAAYWKQALIDAPALLDLPTDQRRPEQQCLTGASVPIAVSATLTSALKRFGEQQGVTLFMTLLSAWAVVLSRLSGQEDIVIGVPSANRSHGEIEPLLGFFVNTLALRVDLGDNPSVAQLIERVRRRVLEAQDHQDLPFEQVVEITQPPRGLSHTPLFQVVFAWQTHDAGKWTSPGLETSPVDSAYEVARFDLELSLAPVEDHIVGALTYSTALFDAATVERHVGYLMTVLAAMAKDERQPVNQLDLIDDSERRLLLERWTLRDETSPPHSCIHELFEAHVARSPEATAVVFEEHTLSYDELNARANRLAHRLMALGVRPEHRIVICVERSPAMVVALIAVLKAGGAYVPFDPENAKERLTFMLADTAPVLVLADATGRRVLGEALQDHLVLDPREVFAEADANPEVPGLTPGNLAYIIYTSGSTGQPKGVMVEHAQLVRLFDTTHSAFGFSSSDTWCLFHSFAFDFSVWELWGALRHGGKVVLVPQAITRAPEAFYRLIDEQGITVLNQTPSAFTALIEHVKPSSDSLRYVIFGGEALQPSTLRDWYQGRDEFMPQLVNMYGITETTVHVTWYPVSSTDAEHIDSVIGRCLPDLNLYLLDADGKPVPIGVVGEMYIGGAGVARGYLNRPGLTAERFLNDPFVGKAGARMYRSGDLARYLANGNLAFMGRNDDQVKIRGYRIELGEIAARLAKHPSVYQAVVVAQGRTDDKRLVAYIVEHDTPVDAEHGLALTQTLRDYLSAGLPQYMVPSAYVRLDNLPLTANGKLDRKALPVPSQATFAHAAYEAPQDKMEAVLAGAWSELLGVDQVGRHDNFFALGGHSLMAVRLLERLRRQGLSLAVRDVFQKPVLSVLASTLRQHEEVLVPPNLIEPGTSVITPELLPLVDLTQSDIDLITSRVPGGAANIQDIYALSPMQDGILFHHMLAKDGDPYLLVTQMAFADREVLERYLDAVQQVVNRHDILRTAFVWEGLSQAVQVVWRQAPLSVTEVVLDLADGPVAEQLSWRFDSCRHRIDLTQAPVLRFIVARDPAADRFMLMQLQHHLIDDASSLQFFYLEVKAFLTNRGETLSSPQPFRNLIGQVRSGKRVDDHERFFKSMLVDVEEPTLPFGLAQVHLDGAQVNQTHRSVSAQLNDRLRAQAKRLNVSLASLCHVAFAQVLARISGQEKVVFGTVLFGRMHAGHGSDSAMGMFINTLPIRLDSGDIDTTTSVHQAHARLAELLAHEHASLALAQRCSGVITGTPLFSALLNYRHNDLSGENTLAQVLERLPGAACLNEQERTNYPFTVSVEDVRHSLGLTAQVVTPFDPDRVCGYMERALESLAQALEHSPQLPVRQLDILPLHERTLLLNTWNATDAPYPNNACIHHLFEAQVARSPEAMALIFEGGTLSYGELNARANRLAHGLVELGIRPDQRIAICVERPADMIVGLMAALKAGGAYVPLDPAYPGDRLTYMLADAAPVLVLVDAVGRQALGDALQLHTVLDFNDTLTNPLTHADADLRLPGLTSRHLAYIIYTSGSTGQPKGVMIEHRGLITSTLARTTLYKTTPDSVFLLLSSMAFDSSAAGIFGTLTTGGALCLVQRKTIVDPYSISRLLSENHATSVLLVPSLARALLPHVAKFGVGLLRHMIVAGEECPASLIQDLRSALPGVALFNEYGPTEATIWAAVHRCCADDVDPVPIGRPIPNTRIYLLDTRGEPVPMGAVGEMYIGGMGVARGYLNLAKPTAERFLLDPFAGKPNARMYKTGDLARYLANGDLVFLGRNDDQVKLRGLRIEPAEIAARLTQHSSIHEAFVEVQGVDPDKRLVAYVVAKPDAFKSTSCSTSSSPLAGHLRDYLSERLPDYMVPSAFVLIEQLPLTPNGKLDRRALPVPDGEAFAHSAFEAPQGETETLLAALWSGLLGVERVSRHDHFFALGGHSLNAVQLIQNVRNYGLGCSLSDLFDYPRLADFASNMAQRCVFNPPAGSITVRAAGTEPSLFFVPSGLADYSYAVALAQQIRTDCPIHVLPWSAIGDPLPRSMEEMAQRMISVIQAIQPDGPYRIAGYSSGGILAHAMAHTLVRARENVTFLGLIDVPAPHQLPYNNHGDKRYFIAHAKTAMPAAERHKLDALDEGDEWVDLITKAQQLGGYDSNAVPSMEVHKWKSIHHFSRMACAYKPTLLPFSVHYFHALECARLDMEEGWKTLLPDIAMTSISIPGNHLTMMQDVNNRKYLADAFSHMLMQGESPHD
ncbi:Tyrocidine synthase 3 [Pseudomonas fluorescens]|nr:Tyrocidine synthase 3 [Pseudomonas fluorescens]